MMTLERLQQLTEAYGARPERWPEAERAAALALIASDPGARRLADEAVKVDRLLDESASAPVTRALEERILAQLPSNGRRSAGFAERLGEWFAARAWLPASALACSLALGLAVGALLPGLVGFGDPGPVDPALLAFGDAQADFWANGENGS